MAIFFGEQRTVNCLCAGTLVTSCELHCKGWFVGCSSSVTEGNTV